MPAGARGEDQHRHRETLLAPPAQGTETVETRQSKVEHDGIIVRGARQKIRALAVFGRVHGISRSLERRRELPRNPRFVFGDENPHSTMLSRYAARLSFRFGSAGCAYTRRMARGSNRGIIIGLVVLVAIALIIKVYGAPIYDMFLEMHGRGGGR